MITVAWSWTVLMSLFVGLVLGTSLVRWELTSRPDKDGVSGPHCIRGRFWYVVPESLYCEYCLQSLRNRLGNKSGD